MAAVWRDRSAIDTVWSLRRKRWLRFTAQFARKRAMVHAIRIHQHGGPEVMKWEEIDVGEPGEGQFAWHRR